MKKMNRLWSPQSRPDAVRKRGLVLALTGAVLLAGLSACNADKEKEPATLVTVQAEKPERGPITEHIVADAVLSPLAQAAIVPKITAPVARFYVQRGAHVHVGELLAALDNRDLTAAAMDSKGQYEAAQAAYDTQTKAQVPEDYEKAKLDVAQAQAEVHLDQTIVDARQKLLAQGAISGRDVDTAQATLVQAKAAYDVAENHLQAMERVSREAALQQAQGDLASAKGKYLGAEAQVSYSEIRSPIAGVVTDRPFFAGETPAPGSPLLTVMDVSALVAKVHLAQAIAQKLHLGDTGQVLIPGVEDPVPAKVSLISPALDPGSTTVEVWLRIDNRSGKYKAGTPVHVSMDGASVASAWKVPLSAVLTAEDGGKSVMVVGSDGTAHRKAVTLGIADGEDVQITNGISGSDTVITGGSYGLDEGTKVKVGPAEDDSGATGDSN